MSKNKSISRDDENRMADKNKHVTEFNITYTTTLLYLISNL